MIMDKQKREFIKAKFIGDSYILSSTTNSLLMHDIRKPSIILSESLYDKAPADDLTEENEINDVDFRIDEETGLMKVVSCYDNGESTI